MNDRILIYISLIGLFLSGVYFGFGLGAYWRDRIVEKRMRYSYLNGEDIIIKKESAK